MVRLLLGLSAGATGISLVALAASGASASESYVVSAELIHQGKAFASPMVVVEPGMPATVKLGDLGFTLTPTVARAGG